MQKLLNRSSAPRARSAFRPCPGHGRNRALGGCPIHRVTKCNLARSPGCVVRSAMSCCEDRGVSLASRCGSLLVVPRAVTLWFATFEHVLEVRVLVKRCAIRHLVDKIFGQTRVVLALSAVGKIVQLRLLF